MALYQQIKEYYLAKVWGIAPCPTIEDLIAPIEAVYYACQCRLYDEALTIYLRYVEQDEPVLGSRFCLTHMLGAWETDLEILLGFFPAGDMSQDPMVNHSKSFIIHAVGMCLDKLGRGYLAESFFERAIDISIKIKHWSNASQDYQSLSSFFWERGELAKSLHAAEKALELAKQAKRMDLECNSIAFLARVYHLNGDLENASSLYLEAETLEKRIDHRKISLYSLIGIHYADHLRRIDRCDYALAITEDNLAICKRNNWQGFISQCYRILGDLYTDAGNELDAMYIYEKALTNARNTSDRLALVEALIGHGRLYARIAGDSVVAFDDLTKALEYAKLGCYRLYEADIRIGLAWAHLVAGDKIKAKSEAEYAKQMSNKMGYYWGKKDADEVLAEIEKASL